MSMAGLQPIGSSLLGLVVGEAGAG